jgi:hypothetical protein
MQMKGRIICLFRISLHAIEKTDTITQHKAKIESGSFIQNGGYIQNGTKMVLLSTPYGKALVSLVNFHVLGIFMPKK